MIYILNSLIHVIPLLHIFWIVPCNEQLTELKNTDRSSMESNGWVFGEINDAFGVGDNHDCKNTNGQVYTWSGGSNVGSLSATLTGSGTGSITFTNCYVGSNVHLYLNGVLLASAGKDQTLTETFSFSNDDVLRLTEEYAVIQIKHAEFGCEY